MSERARRRARGPRAAAPARVRPRSARAIARATRRHTDLVHAHKGIAHSVALAATFLRSAAPLIVANRGVSFPLDFINRWKYRVRIEAVVTVCEDIRR